MARLLVIGACCECPHSRERAACFHPDTEGRTDPYGDPPLNDGSGHPLQCSRALPPVPAGGHGWPQHQPPPEWCPLPKPEDAP